MIHTIILTTGKLFSLLSVFFQAQSGLNSLKPNPLKPDRVWKRTESNEKSFTVGRPQLDTFGTGVCLTTTNHNDININTDNDNDNLNNNVVNINNDMIMIMIE